MNDTTDPLAWLTPSLIVFGVAIVLIAALWWGIRILRTGPRARAAADAARAAAGSSLVALDDAVSELDIEVGLSGALYGGDAAAALRRARIAATHARDDAFETYAHTLDLTVPLARRRAIAREVKVRADRALEGVERTRTAHSAWVGLNIDAPTQLASSRERLIALDTEAAGIRGLIDDLTARFDADEWADARREGEEFVAAVARARDALESATTIAQDPTQSLLPSLATAERALRDAEESATHVEEDHRRINSAAIGVNGEINAARAAIRAALSLREGLEPDAADRLGPAIDAADAALTRIAVDAERRPTAAVDAIARERDRLDLALGDARSAQQRLRGARSALPGTLAAARNAIAHATVAVRRANTGAEARVRLAAAENAVADARRASDPVAALDAARRALRHADDAKALSDYDLLG